MEIHIRFVHTIDCYFLTVLSEKNHKQEILATDIAELHCFYIFSYKLCGCIDDDILFFYKTHFTNIHYCTEKSVELLQKLAFTFGVVRDKHRQFFQQLCIDGQKKQ